MTFRTHTQWPYLYVCCVLRTAISVVGSLQSGCCGAATAPVTVTLTEFESDSTPLCHFMFVDVVFGVFQVVLVVSDTLQGSIKLVLTDLSIHIVVTKQRYTLMKSLWTSHFFQYSYAKPKTTFLCCHWDWDFTPLLYAPDMPSSAPTTTP